MPPNAVPRVKNFDFPFGSSVTSTQPASRIDVRARACVIGQGEPARTGEAIGLLVTYTTVPAPRLERIGDAVHEVEVAGVHVVEVSLDRGRVLRTARESARPGARPAFAAGVGGLAGPPGFPQAIDKVRTAAGEDAGKA